MQYVYIFLGGTFNPVAPHLALAAPAFGKVGVDIFELFLERIEENTEGSYSHLTPVLLPTSMAIGEVYERLGERYLHASANVFSEVGLTSMRTNEDVAKVVDFLIQQTSTRCIIMSSALCDFEASKIGNIDIPSGHVYYKRLESKHNWTIELSATEKIIDRIRKKRKDIFLVSFKATYNEPETLYAKALSQLKRTSSNLVFANDVGVKVNMVVTPEEYPYSYESRIAACYSLVDMTLMRLNLQFFRTIMRQGEEKADLKKLESKKSIPDNFIPVLSYLISQNAYKEFMDKTTGHFGCIVEGEDFHRISSVRKANHNRVLDEGVSKIYVNSGAIEAGGAKPSVGEHTQQQIYEHLKGKVHSIVHFHCPLKNADNFHAVRNQFFYECGSYECGTNTIKGLVEFEPGIWAVHLQQHGPNIAFHKDVDSNKIISFIEKFWDLSKKEGGLVHM